MRKLKFNKFRAFTLSELMIMLAVLTILLAAFAPVFTVRYNNASSDNVWSYVADDEEYDAYSDQINKILPAQLFIGISPSGSSEVLKAIKNGSSNPLYSKVVIRATNNLSGTEKLQKAIQFRYGNSGSGSIVGALFAGNENILLGGNYSNISSSAEKNAAFGYGALSSITSGKRNSALGYKTLMKLTTGYDNTAIGSYTGEDITSRFGNTLIGYKSTTGDSGDYVTAISDMYSKSDDSTVTRGTGTTAIGHYAAVDVGNYNTAIGYKSMSSGGGSYNTAVGSKSLGDNKMKSNNTAIGYGACSKVTGSNKTCIGSESGTEVKGSYNDKLLSDDVERIFIGGPILETLDYDSNNNLGGAAVLEVHNPDSKFTSGNLGMDLGNSTVLVNGNLVVRGQTYLGVRNVIRDYRAGSLVGFHIIKPKTTFQHSKVFSGYDGQERDVYISGNCRGCRRHSYASGKSNCTCAMEAKDSSGTAIKSYDWTTNGTVSHGGCGNSDFGYGYTDKSTGATIAADNNNKNYAHMSSGNSCCPDLRSDIRLKNLSGKFTAGLDEIKRLKIYNYTYKSDDTKNPHVGVIAQDLKRVFPTAVTKDENGYYSIRWDEMFYAAINAIKTINTKVEALASRVVKDQTRIANLKKDNAQLEKQLTILSNELANLEKNRK